MSAKHLETEYWSQCFDDELWIVEYDITPASRGARGSCGEPIEPDEPTSVDIVRVTDAEGDEVPDPMWKPEWSEIEQQILDEHQEQYLNDLETEAERRNQYNGNDQ